MVPSNLTNPKRTSLTSQTRRRLVAAFLSVSALCLSATILMPAPVAAAPAQPASARATSIPADAGSPAARSSSASPSPSSSSDTSMAGPSAAAVKKLSGYEIDQITSMEGKVKVYASANAVRFDHITYGYSVVSSAPKWDVWVFRADTKSAAVLPYKEWLKTNLLLMTSWTQELRKPTSQSHVERNGRAYVSYIFPSTGAVTAFKSNEGQEFAKRLENNRGEVVCLDFPADVHAGGVVGRVYGLPELQGIAVQATRRSATATGWTVRTVKEKKRDDLPADIFLVPKGYKTVPFDRSLFRSAGAKSAIDELFGRPEN